MKKGMCSHNGAASLFLFPAIFHVDANSSQFSLFIDVFKLWKVFFCAEVSKF
jgi:hypothetical protein